MADDVHIATFPNEMLAQFWAGILENEGIRSMIKPLLGGYGVWGQRSYMHHGLYVLEKDAEQAQALLGEVEGEGYNQ